MTDPGQRLRQERQPALNDVAALDLGLTGDGADDDRIIFETDAAQFRQAQDVDQPRRTGQAHCQHGNKGLPACYDARILVAGQ